MLRPYVRYFSAMQVIFTNAIYRLRLDQLNAFIAFDDEKHPDWSVFAKTDFWLDFRKSCEELELDSVVAQIDRMVEAFKRKPEIEPSELEAMLVELRNRIKDQLGRRLFLYVPASKVLYWENEEYFGDEVANKIPDAGEDIAEACSCFAVGRNQAAVYHCMGIMQAGLFAIGRKLGCTVDLNLALIRK